MSADHRRASPARNNRVKRSLNTSPRTAPRRSARSWPATWHWRPWSCRTDQCQGRQIACEDEGRDMRYQPAAPADTRQSRRASRRRAAQHCPTAMIGSGQRHAVEAGRDRPHLRHASRRFRKTRSSHRAEQQDRQRQSVREGPIRKRRSAMGRSAVIFRGVGSIDKAAGFFYAAAAYIGPFLRSCRTLSPHRRESTLLRPGRSGAVFRRQSARARADLVLFCDHAGRAFPASARNAGAGTTRARPAYRLGHRHRRDWGGGSARSLDAPLFLHGLFAAGDRLQPAARRSDLDRRRRATASSMPGNRGLTRSGSRRRGSGRSSGPITRRWSQGSQARLARRRIAGRHLAAFLHAGDERLPAALACRRAVEPRCPAAGAADAASARRSRTWWSATTSPIRAVTATATRSRPMPRRWAWRMGCSRSARI